MTRRQVFRHLLGAPLVGAAAALPPAPIEPPPLNIVIHEGTRLTPRNLQMFAEEIQRHIWRNIVANRGGRAAELLRPNQGENRWPRRT